jgi:hypothetical protein
LKDNEDFIIESTNQYYDSIKYASQRLIYKFEVLYKEYRSLDKIGSVLFIHNQKEKLNCLHKFGGDFDLSIKFNLY